MYEILLLIGCLMLVLGYGAELYEDGVRMDGWGAIRHGMMMLAYWTLFLKALVHLLFG